MRIVTRGDLDGAVCAALIHFYESVEDLELLHPQDVIEGRADIREGDVIANLPYHPNCARWFDHHPSGERSHQPPEGFDGRHELVPSAAQLVWEYYGSDPRWSELIRETNRLDSADLTREDVLEPSGYILLGLTLDSRSGLGAYHYYFRKCVDWLQRLPIDRILQIPDVAAKVERMRSENKDFLETLRSSSRLDDNVIVTDFRDSFFTPVGNRFLVYTLWPEANVSLRIHWGPDRRFVVAAVGHSILNRSCQTHVGELLTWFGGGGHRGAGTAPLPVEDADEQIERILQVLKSNG